VTSLAWCLLVLIILSFKDMSSGSTTNDAHRNSGPKSGKQVAIARSHGFRPWETVHPVIMDRGQPGSGGKPVKVPKSREEERKEKFRINQFNLVASEMISLNRSLQDVRLAACKSKTYPELLPTTSVVIVFHHQPVAKGSGGGDHPGGRCIGAGPLGQAA